MTNKKKGNDETNPKWENILTHLYGISQQVIDNNDITNIPKDQMVHSWHLLYRTIKNEKQE